MEILIALLVLGTYVEFTVADRPACSPPKCPEDCPIDYDAYPCPACNCSQDYDPGTPACSPPKCPEDCPIDYDA
ncbi:hypothetical protein AVEN_157927-1, partial [Araneus ventricosus]